MHVSAPQADAAPGPSSAMHEAGAAAVSQQASRARCATSGARRRSNAHAPCRLTVTRGAVVQVRNRHPEGQAEASGARPSACNLQTKDTRSRAIAGRVGAPATSGVHCMVLRHHVHACWSFAGSGHPSAGLAGSQASQRASHRWSWNAAQFIPTVTHSATGECWVAAKVHACSCAPCGVLIPGDFDVVQCLQSRNNQDNGGGSSAYHHAATAAPRSSAPKVSKAVKSKSNASGRTYTSRFRGVHQTFPTRRWEAQFRRNGKPTSLGEVMRVVKR